MRWKWCNFSVQTGLAVPLVAVLLGDELRGQQTGREHSGKCRESYQQHVQLTNGKQIYGYEQAKI